MKPSIQKKIVLIYLCTIIIIMLVSGTYIVYGTEERDYTSIQHAIENMAETIENNKNFELVNIIDSYEVYILDSQGFTHASNTGEGIGLKKEEAVVIQARTTKKSATSPAKHFSSIKNQANGYLDHARPILNEETGEIERIIYIKASTREVYYNMMSIIRTIGIGLIFAMVITSFCAIVFSRMITAPIKTLTKNSKKLAAGNTIGRIPVEAADEIGELTQSFNIMASQLSSTMEVLTSEKNKLEKIFEHMADGVMAFSQQGILIHVNSSCYEIVGKEKMGPNFEVISERMGLLVEFERLLAGEHYESLDDYVIMDDKFLKIQFAPYLNAKGEAEGLVMVIQDVTKQQKLDQMRKEFVANVSHELRTPLTTLKIYTETLLDGAIDDKENAMHFLGVMEKEADRMTALVQDLLELSRIDNKQIQLNFTKLDLRDMLEEVLEAQHVHIIKKGHTLSVVYDELIPHRIEGDAFRIRQILHNILSNAIKYTDEAGNIAIRMIKEEGKIHICVEDTGMGIPKEDVERIFERFYRVDKARSRKQGGTGLGLSIAKELMTLHGGDIHISSKLGKGTRVYLTFNELG